MTRGNWLWLVVSACNLPTGSTSGDSDGGDLTWYFECGDPACQGYTGPFDGVDLCADVGVKVGTPCIEAGAQCDPVDACNALAVCAADDPQAQTGACPISLRKFKKDIRYLSTDERAAAAKQVLGLPLAQWRYAGKLDDGRDHLGFIIDDAPGSPAVQASGSHVDLYGYTSLAVAALQQQQAELDALRAEVEALKTSCAPR